MESKNREERREGSEGNGTNLRSEVSLSESFVINLLLLKNCGKLARILNIIRA